MKSVIKLIKRFVGILLCSGFLLLLFNFLFILILSTRQLSGGHPWKYADDISKALQSTNSGYVLDQQSLNELAEENVWAILIDNDSKTIVWESSNTPENLPDNYSLSDISMLTRGYLKDYPTFTASHPDGLLVLGYSKTSYWKHMYNGWDYHLIANFFNILLLFLFGNILIIFLIYVIANTGLLKSIRPILSAIQDLPTGSKVRLPEKGVLSELAQKINQTSERLITQESELKKKETARANWIAGVSHDIRTPLSMVMGYAAQLECNSELSSEDHQKASIIRKQSERMKQLINDLNLASKLEYNMQPVHIEQFNLVSVLRQTIVDFMNTDMNGTYPIDVQIPKDVTPCFVLGDAALLQRAITNLYHNSINHNEAGCNIYVSLYKEKGTCFIHFEDDGIGATLEQIEQLNHMPHYMVCDESTKEQRHGLGLLIVKQIVEVHHGTVELAQSKKHGGFSVSIQLPLETNK